MLHLFPERYQAAVGPNQLAIRMRQGFTRNGKGVQLALFDYSAIGGNPKHPSFQALQTYFSELKPSVRELDLIFSDSFFQFVLIPWSDQLLRLAERESLARIQLEAAYGTAAKRRIKIDSAGYGRPAIACAFDGELMTELEIWAKQTHIRLNSVQPHFMLAFNRCRARLNAECVFITQEHGHCIMLYVRDNTPCALRTFIVSSPDSGKFAELLEREMILLDVAEKATVYCYGFKPDELRFQEQWGFVRLGLDNPAHTSGIASMFNLEKA